MAWCGIETEPPAGGGFYKNLVQLTEPRLATPPDSLHYALCNLATKARIREDSAINVPNITFDKISFEQTLIVRITDLGPTARLGFKCEGAVWTHRGVVVVCRSPFRYLEQ